MTYRSKPRLLHIFPCFGAGGPEVRTTDLINRTSDQFQHSVLAIHPETSGQDRVKPGNEFACRSLDDSSVRTIRNAVRQQSPDAVFTYGWGGVDALLATRLCGIRKVVHMEDGFLDDERHQQKRSRRLARRLLFPLARKVIVPSRTLETVARQSWKVPAGRLLYIPNGIDGSRFRPCGAETDRQALKERLGIDRDAVVIGTVSGLRPEKNQSRLLHAFAAAVNGADSQAQRQSLHLMIVGDGPLAGELVDLAAQLGLADRTTFCGAIADPADHYRAMDVFALSSDTEQMPLCVLEAMATGLPVVSTDVGDVRTMVSQANQRCIVSQDNLSAYTDAILQLACDREQRCNLGGANRDLFARQFTLEKMVESYRQLYAETCGGSLSMTLSTSA